MTSFSEAIASALQHHQGGRLQAAEQIYQQILAVNPQHVDALHLLGILSCQMGKHAAGAEHMERAVQLWGSEAAIHNNLGIAYKELRRYDEALACCRRALELQPQFAAAYHNLGDIARGRGELDQAAQAYQRALELGSDAVETNLLLGIVFRNQGKLTEAIDRYQRVLKLKPDHVEAHYNMGIALVEQGKLAEAEDCYRRALERKPDHAEAHINLGNIFKDQGKLDEAAACYRRAMEVKPDHADAHYNLGNALADQGKLEEAVVSYRRALELKPEYVLAHYNLGNIYYDLCRLDAAVASFQRALELDPNFVKAHLNRAYTWLLAGNFKRGLPALEARWHDKPRRPFSQPMWGGEPLAGKTILLHAEQGLGDTIQFIRFAPALKQLGATVVVECRKRLLPLLASCPGIDRLVGRETTLPAFDVHVPFISVPGILKTTIDTIPATVPYIQPPPALVEQWRERLSALDGFKIGITWQGNPEFRFDRFRSIPLRHFAPLGQLPEVRLISLQKGAGTEQLNEIRDQFAVTVLSEDMDQQAGVFMDTAAVMKNLDLVITSDTATAHLAGALAVPVWVALAFAPDWRWLLDRSDSPWYPTMRLFRQQKRGDWPSVFEEIKQALCNFNPKR